MLSAELKNLLDEMEASGDIQQYYVQEAVRTLAGSRDSVRELLGSCQELLKYCQRVVERLENETGLNRYTVVLKNQDEDHPGCQVVHRVTAAGIPEAIWKSKQLMEEESPDYYPEMVFRGWFRLVAHQPERLDYRIMLEDIAETEEDLDGDA
jgi:hypothetical protein